MPKKIKVTKELIRKHFGPDAEISGGGWLFDDDFKVKTKNGEKFTISHDGGIYQEPSKGRGDLTPALLLLRELGVTEIKVTKGNDKDIMAWVIQAQALGMTVKAGKPEQGWFFPKEAVHVPKPSGAHGSAGIATDKELADAKLTGAKWGQGIRIGHDRAGNVMRYLGENSLITIGAPGTGKFTDLICPAMIEYGTGGSGASRVIVDQKGQISAVTIEECRKHSEVIVLSPFTEGLPEGLPELLGPSHSYNPMRVLLNPQSEAFELTCDALAEIIIPDERGGE